MKLEQLKAGRKVYIVSVQEEQPCVLHDMEHNSNRNIPLRDEDGVVHTADIDELYLSVEDAEQLEAEFQKLFDEVHPQIQEKIEQAHRLIQEACALSEEHGIPFRPKHRLTFIRPSYIPESFKEKFPELEDDSWADITGAHGGYDGNGWQYSQTC